MDYSQLLDRLKETLQKQLPKGQSQARQLSEILGIKPPFRIPEVERRDPVLGR